MIEIIGTELNQWDTGRSVKVTSSEASKVHFANQGDSRAVIMDLINSESKIPDYLLQTGKQLCVYAVANGVTMERKMFSVKKRERPENYVYDEDQRNFIYELIASAENAVENASLATENANDAADKALKAASSWVMVGEASGESVVINDAVEQSFAGFRIFGKTTQDGTPTPDAPVDIVSVGDSGSIAIDVTGKNEGQRMIIATPNGLPGIPVTSGGNYTDANGQQWICDEIDFARGVYVQRIETVVLDGRTNAVLKTDNNVGYYQYVHRLSKAKQNIAGYCTHFSHMDGYPVKTDDAFSLTKHPGILLGGYGIVSGDNSTITDSEFNDWLYAQYANGSPVVIYYVLEDPIETPLTKEEFAAYASLHTYRGNTTVSNDAGAYMELEYVMDAKKYIDSLFVGGIVPATVE